MTYGKLPIDLGKFPIKWDEVCLCLNLPIKMAGDGAFIDDKIRIPRRFLAFKPLVDFILSGIVRHPELSIKERTKFHTYLRERYIYITVKHLLVTPYAWQDRGGAHTLGFGTDDRHWIWCDKNPPEFNTAEFDIKGDFYSSLKEFDNQWDYKKQVVYPPFHLLELNPYVVHRVVRVTRYDMRTFVKISLSKHKYNMIGNAHNDLFDYDWEMVPRGSERNPDFIPAMLQ